MKDKYISASTLKAHYSWLGKDATLSPKDVDDIVDAQPESDVELIVRGEWKDGKCTNCGCFGYPTFDGGNERTAFCSHCGANMTERSGSGDK